MLTILLCLTLLLGMAVGPANVTRAAPGAEWMPIGSWSGTTPQRTEAFETVGQAWRILWSVSDVQPVSMLTVLVYQADGVLQTTAVQATGLGEGVAQVQAPPGRYTLQVDSGSLNWSITVEDDR